MSDDDFAGAPDERTRRLEELWTRYLARAPLDEEERTALLAAVRDDGPFRQRVVQDLQLEGALRAAAEIERGQEPTVSAVRALVAAAGRTEEVVQAVRKRLESSGRARAGGLLAPHGPARAVPRSDSPVARGRGARLAAAAVLVAGAAVAVLVLRPWFDRPASRAPVAESSGREGDPPAESERAAAGEQGSPDPRAGEGTTGVARAPLARLEVIHGSAHRHGADGSVRAGSALGLEAGDWVSTSGVTARARLVGPGGSQVELQGDAVAALARAGRSGDLPAGLPSGPGAPGGAGLPSDPVDRGGPGQSGRPGALGGPSEAGRPGALGGPSEPGRPGALGGPSGSGSVGGALAGVAGGRPAARLFVAHGRAEAALPAGSGAAALVLATPHAIVTGEGTLRLEVGPAATRVEVRTGRARVSALAVQRGTDLRAGQFALVNADDLHPPPAQASPPEALLLVGPDDTKEEPLPGERLRSSEERMRARLTRLGFRVTVVEARGLSLGQAQAAALMVLSSSVSAQQLGAWFVELPVPMLALESTALERLGLTGARWGRDVGTAPPQSEVVILDPGHPMAAGFSGTVRVLSPALNVRWALPAPGAKVIASYATAHGQAALVFGYDRGDAMASGTAPARRVALFLGNGRIIRALTDAGWRLFDAAALWAAGR